MIDSSYFELGQTEWQTKFLKMKIETLYLNFNTITSRHSKVQSSTTVTKLVQAK